VSSWLGNLGYVFDCMMNSASSGPAEVGSRRLFWPTGGRGEFFGQNDLQQPEHGGAAG
jgi:hypothetical protein